VLYSLEVTSANDTTTHYAAIYCPRLRTIGFAIQHAYMTSP